MVFNPAKIIIFTSEEERRKSEGLIRFIKDIDLELILHSKKQSPELYGEVIEQLSSAKIFFDIAKAYEGNDNLEDKAKEFLQSFKGFFSTIKQKYPDIFQDIESHLEKNKNKNISFDSLQQRHNNLVLDSIREVHDQIFSENFNIDHYPNIVVRLADLYNNLERFNERDNENIVFSQLKDLFAKIESSKPELLEDCKYCAQMLQDKDCSRKELREQMKLKSVCDFIKESLRIINSTTTLEHLAETGRENLEKAIQTIEEIESEGISYKKIERKINNFYKKYEEAKVKGSEALFQFYKTLIIENNISEDSRSEELNRRRTEIGVRPAASLPRVPDEHSVRARSGRSQQQNRPFAAAAATGATGYNVPNGYNAVTDSDRVSSRQAWGRTQNVFVGDSTVARSQTEINLSRIRNQHQPFQEQRQTEIQNSAQPEVNSQNQNQERNSGNILRRMARRFREGAEQTRLRLPSLPTLRRRRAQITPVEDNPAGSPESPNAVSLEEQRQNQR